MNDYSVGFISLTNNTFWRRSEWMKSDHESLVHCIYQMYCPDNATREVFALNTQNYTMYALHILVMWYTQYSTAELIAREAGTIDTCTNPSAVTFINEK